MAAAVPPDDIAYVTALVRESDRPRYYATLLAPAGIRADLFALYGFAAEIARVPDQVSEPALGEIRLRWWQDALAQATASDGRGGAPALRAAAGAIGRHRLPLEPFNSLIEARSADLYSDPPAAVSDIEGRLGETESVLFQMAAIVFGAAGPETAEAAGHAGVAYGIARRLALLSSERVRARTILPSEILERAGVSAAALFASTPPAGLANGVAELVQVGRRHLAEAKARVATLPRSVRVAFLPLAVVLPLLSRIEKLGAAIGEHEARPSDLESLLRIWLARLG